MIYYRNKSIVVAGALRSFFFSENVDHLALIDAQIKQSTDLSFLMFTKATCFDPRG
jgi:hypothetical protein